MRLKSPTKRHTPPSTTSTTPTIVDSPPSVSRRAVHPHRTTTTAGGTPDRRRHSSNNASSSPASSNGPSPSRGGRLRFRSAERSGDAAVDGTMRDARADSTSIACAANLHHHTPSSIPLPTSPSSTVGAALYAGVGVAAPEQQTATDDGAAVVDVVPMSVRNGKPATTMIPQLMTMSTSSTTSPSPPANAGAIRTTRTTRLRAAALGECASRLHILFYCTLPLISK